MHHALGEGDPQAAQGARVLCGLVRSWQGICMYPAQLLVLNILHCSTIHGNMGLAKYHEVMLPADAQT